MGDVVPLRTDLELLLRDDMGHAVRSDRASIVRDRRLAWGMGIRQRRLDQGISSRVLALRLGLPTPTLVSAVEAGRARIPEGALRHWAEALCMDPSVFAAEYLATFEPDAFAALEGSGTHSYFGGVAP